MILSCPVYVYGLFLIQEPRTTKAVWPPILLNSVYLMLTPLFFKSHSLIHRLSDRAGIVIGVIITSAGITINGLLSSSDSSYLIGTLFYGALGGKAYCIISLPYKVKSIFGWFQIYNSKLKKQNKTKQFFYKH